MCKYIYIYAYQVNALPGADYPLHLLAEFREFFLAQSGSRYTAKLAEHVGSNVFPGDGLADLGG